MNNNIIKKITVEILDVTENASRDATENVSMNATRKSTRDVIYDATWGQTNNLTYNASWWAPRMAIHEFLSDL